MSQVASTENHLSFVLTAVNRVTNSTIAWNVTLLMTILHCNICFALKYSLKIMFSFVKSITLTKTQALFHCATRGYFNAANLGGSGSRCIHRSTMKYTKSVHFMLKCLFFYFLWSVNSCPIKALTVASGNTFSNHWAFTVTETEALKYHF